MKGFNLCDPREGSEKNEDFASFVYMSFPCLPFKLLDQDSKNLFTSAPLSPDDRTLWSANVDPQRDRKERMNGKKRTMFTKGEKMNNCVS